MTLVSGGDRPLHHQFLFLKDAVFSAYWMDACPYLLVVHHSVSTVVSVYIYTHFNAFEVTGVIII